VQRTAAVMSQAKLLNHLVALSAESRSRAAGCTDRLSIVIGQRVSTERVRDGAVRDAAAEDDSDSSQGLDESVETSEGLHDSAAEAAEHDGLVMFYSTRKQRSSAVNEALKLADCGKGFAAASRNPNTLGYMRSRREQSETSRESALPIRALHHEAAKIIDSSSSGGECLSVKFVVHELLDGIKLKSKTTEVTVAVQSDRSRQMQQVRGCAAVADSLSVARRSPADPSHRDTWGSWDVMLGCADELCTVQHALLDASKRMLRLRAAAASDAGGLQLERCLADVNAPECMHEAEPWAATEASKVFSTDAAAATAVAAAAAVQQRMVTNLETSYTDDACDSETLALRTVFRAAIQCDSVRVGGRLLLDAMTSDAVKLDTATSSFTVYVSPQQADCTDSANNKSRKYDHRDSTLQLAKSICRRVNNSSNSMLTCKYMLLEDSSKRTSRAQASMVPVAQLLRISRRAPATTANDKVCKLTVHCHNAVRQW
jgi:hypothetical protein